MDPVTPRAGRGKTQDPNTPQRRSLYDLQRLIDEVFDGFTKESSVLAEEDSAGAHDRTCRAADLPAILTAFEQKRSITLLDDSEMETLKAFTEQHPDLDVSSEQLVSLLSAMTADSKSEASSPSKIYEKQLPTPPASDAELGEMRSRSSSSSSGSSSSRNSAILTASGTLEDSITSPSLFDTEPVFPRSYSMPDGVVQHLASPPGTPIANMHQRSHTVGDLARAARGTPNESGIPRPSGLLKHARANSGQQQQHTPLSAGISGRQRSSPLLELQTDSALRRARPAPPKSRRISGGMTPSNSTGSIASLDGRRSRQSSNENPVSPRMMSPLERATSPLFASSLNAMHEAGDSSFDNMLVYPRSRQNSGGVRGSSPLFDTSPPPQGGMMQGTMFPPQSPSLDATSFHSVPASPHELRNEMDGFSADHAYILHTRPISTASVNSEAAVQEMIQALQQELSRKNQDLEAQRADSYSSLMEKEALLEEVRAELIAKRKEEKELRGKEKVNLSQIATLEAQTATFRDDRDKQKTAYQNARKQYEEQCNESEKLRNVIRSKDEELRVADETLANANSDLAKITRERDYLQTQITRLEEELVETKATVDALEEQKTENLQLKETIDRLRLDLDELRTQARANAESKTGGAALSRSASGQESVPATLSKNLGRELARRFAGEAEQETAEPQKQDVPDCHLEDTYEEEEIVTTRRRLKRPATRKADATQASNEDAITSSDREQLSLEVCDVQIQVSPPEIVRADQTTQTEKEEELSMEERRSALARDLSVNLDAVEEYLREKEERARQQAAEPDTAPPPYQSAPVPARTGIFQPYTTVISREAKTILDLGLQSSGSLLGYTLVIFISGLLTGSTMMPVRHHHHVAPFDPHGNWIAYNTLDLAQGAYNAGWMENTWFAIERLIWSGISTGRRIPS